MNEPQVARTGSTPRRLLRFAPGILLVGLMTAGFMLSLFRPSILQLRARGGILDGGLASDYQNRYEQDLFLRRLAVQVWGAISYGVFGEGRTGVLIGEEGWLFTTEEFAAAGEPAIRAAIRRVGAVRDALEERGIGLVVALVPAKARIYPDKLGAYRFPASAASRYERFRDGLLAAGISVPNLASVLREARARGEVFLRTDTHWSPLGARTAAAAVAAAGRDVLAESGIPPAAFRTRYGGNRSYRGDLLGFIPLGTWQDSLGPEPDLLGLYETEEIAPGHLGLFDTVEIPVTLVGTSYSAGRQWNFEGALKEMLGADVLNVAEEGRGPVAPMQAYLAGDTLREIAPTLVVWEIPERYIPVLAE